MINQITNSNNRKNYDLEERTAKFGGEIIYFSKNIEINPVNSPLINQLVRSGTSIGANYCEANESSSKKDFTHKIGIAKKEAKETMYWLRIVSQANPDKKNKAQDLWQQAREFVLIFSAIIKSSKKLKIEN